MQQARLTKQEPDSDEEFWEQERTQLPGTLIMDAALSDPERSVTSLSLAPRWG